MRSARHRLSCSWFVRISADRSALYVSDFTIKGILNFRQHVSDRMLCVWIELMPILVAQSAVMHPTPCERLIDWSGSVASASEASDRASQNSQIILAVDSSMRRFCALHGHWHA